MNHLLTRGFGVHEKLNRQNCEARCGEHGRRCGEHVFNRGANETKDKTSRKKHRSSDADADLDVFRHVQRDGTATDRETNGDNTDAHATGFDFILDVLVLHSSKRRLVVQNFDEGKRETRARQHNGHIQVEMP